MLRWETITPHRVSEQLVTSPKNATDTPAEYFQLNEQFSYTSSHQHYPLLPVHRHTEGEA